MSSVVLSKKIRRAPAGKKDASLFLDCFRSVTERHQCWNKWIAFDAWIDIINSHCDVHDDLKFSSAQLNRAVSRNTQFESNLIETTAVANPQWASAKLHTRVKGKVKKCM